MKKHVEIKDQKLYKKKKKQLAGESRALPKRNYKPIDKPKPVKKKTTISKKKSMEIKRAEKTATQKHEPNKKSRKKSSRKTAARDIKAANIFGFRKFKNTRHPYINDKLKRQNEIKKEAEKIRGKEMTRLYHGSNNPNIKTLKTSESMESTIYMTPSLELAKGYGKHIYFVDIDYPTSFHERINKFLDKVKNSEIIDEHDDGVYEITFDEDMDVQKLE
jgi:hypothetical protein